jgi:hypothetical protein
MQDEAMKKKITFVLSLIISIMIILSYLFSFLLGLKQDANETINFSEEISITSKQHDQKDDLRDTQCNKKYTNCN